MTSIYIENAPPTPTKTSKTGLFCGRNSGGYYLRAKNSAKSGYVEIALLAGDQCELVAHEVDETNTNITPASVGTAVRVIAKGAQ